MPFKEKAALFEVNECEIKIMVMSRIQETYSHTIWHATKVGWRKCQLTLSNHD